MGFQVPMAYVMNLCSGYAFSIQHSLEHNKMLECCMQIWLPLGNFNLGVKVFFFSSMVV